ncbi:MAG: hypothetical protein ACW97P_04640 [Candidatus Hodarchaeales archaeon]|jgi:hypothetical protein
MAFIKEELEELTKEQLCELAGYYSIDVNMRMLKGEIINEIVLGTKPFVDVGEPQMSVRIRRIRESQEE